MYKLMKKIMFSTLLLIIISGCTSIKQPPHAVQLHEKPFYMGVFMYTYAIAKTAKDRGENYLDFLEKQFKILQDNGVNAIHLTFGSWRYFDDYLRLAEKYDMTLIPQIYNPYFRPAWTEEQMRKNAKKAGKFIAKYSDNPRVLAWSLFEEANHPQIIKLAKYFAMIKEYAPKAKFSMLHAFLSAAKAQQEPHPIIFGTDRYAFWWEFSGGGYLMSPTYSLDWVRKQAAAFQQEAAKRDADFMLTITQGGLQLHRKGVKMLQSPETMTYPKSLEVRKKMFAKIKKLAEEERLGWGITRTTDGKELYRCWKYYRLPENCMKALAWTGVLEGAKVFLCWSFTPPDNATIAGTINNYMTSKKSIGGLWTLAGRPGKPNPQLAEFKEASREIRKYERIITQMNKLPTSPIMTNSQKRFYNCAFSIPKINGKVIVIHNGNVGIGPANNAYVYRENADVKIDDDGNLVGYKALDKPMKARFEITELSENGGIYDLEFGEKIENTDGAYSVEIMPGSGKLLFVGTEEEANLLASLVEK